MPLPMTEELRRASARAAARKAIIRGHLRRQPCQRCSKEKAEMHHEDYTLPLYVIWLCRHCHRRFHGYVRAVPIEVFLTM